MKNVKYLLCMAMLTLSVAANAAQIVSGNGNYVISNSSNSIIAINGRTIVSNGVEDKSPITTEERDLGLIKGVVMTGDVDVIYIKAEKPSLSISASKNTLANLKTSNDDGMLNFHYSNAIQTGKPAVITIKGPSFLEVDSVGVGDFSGKGIDGSSFSVRLLGTGDVSLAGRVDNANFILNGTGDIKASDFVVKNLTVLLNGTGDVSANVSESVSGSNGGTGDILVKGSPKSRNIANGGAGNVEYE